MSHPRVMIAAPKSGSGKTVFTIGLLRLLLDRGLSPASFKCGPDYIDPMFHAKVLGIPSKNLDLFFAPGETVRGLFCDGAEGAGISVIEGVMGYYDGVGGIMDRASSYDLARELETPVVLLADVKGMSLSAVPLLKGLLDYRKDSGIRGVVLNRCGSTLYALLKDTIERETGLTVLGHVPEVPDFSLGSRHLGLITPEEIGDLEARIRRVAETMAGTVDVEGILRLAETAPDIRGTLPGVKPFDRPRRIAVARDAAFCFYYEDNLNLLRRMGGEIVFFSPLQDEALPTGTEAVYLGGGYPELHARELSANRSMAEAIRTGAENGLPVVAECGGYLYLCRSLTDMNGEKYPMAGLIEADGFYTGKLTRFGYTELSLPMKAHEFHYFDTTDNGDQAVAVKPVSGRTWKCIHRFRHVTAGFPHLYFYSSPETVYELFQ